MKVAVITTYNAEIDVPWECDGNCDYFVLGIITKEKFEYLVQNYDMVLISIKCKVYEKDTLLKYIMFTTLDRFNLEHTNVYLLNGWDDRIYCGMVLNDELEIPTLFVERASYYCPFKFSGLKSSVECFLTKYKEKQAKLAARKAARALLKQQKQQEKLILDEISNMGNSSLITV